MTGRVAWALLAAALSAAAAATFASGLAAALQWQPDLAGREPWRAWTAAAVHYSAYHLLANLAGAALVAALGVVARLDRSAAIAWFFAWPLTHWGLLLRPDLVAYGGLSGVLHAGVAVAALRLLIDGERHQRWVGAAIALGLVLKVVSESPAGDALQRFAGADVAVAPFAHATGTVAGLGCAVAVRLVSAWLARRADTIAPHV